MVSGSEDHFDQLMTLLKLSIRPSEAPVVAYKLIESARVKIHSLSQDGMDSNVEVFSANIIKGKVHFLIQ